MNATFIFMSWGQTFWCFQDLPHHKNDHLIENVLGRGQYLISNTASVGNTDVVHPADGDTEP